MTEHIPYKGKRVDLKSAAKILGLSVSGVRLWIEQGKLEKAESNSNKIFVFVTDEMIKEAESRIQDREQTPDEPPARPDPVTNELIEKITAFMEGEIAEKGKQVEEYRARAERFEKECDALKGQVETIPFKEAEIAGLQEKIAMRDDQIQDGRKRISELEDSCKEFKRHAIIARREKLEIEKQSRIGWGAAVAVTVLFVILAGFTVYNGNNAPQSATSSFAAISPASGP